jgi:hypothetical protein
MSSTPGASGLRRRPCRGGTRSSGGDESSASSSRTAATSFCFAAIALSNPRVVSVGYSVAGVLVADTRPNSRMKASDASHSQNKLLNSLGNIYIPKQSTGPSPADPCGQAHPHDSPSPQGRMGHCIDG